jgi:hypothetical protein
MLITRNVLLQTANCTKKLTTAPSDYNSQDTQSYIEPIQPIYKMKKNNQKVTFCAIRSIMSLLLAVTMKMT